MDELRLRLLGGVQITLGGARVGDFTSKKSPALLSYLAVTGRPHSREALSGLLWGESSEKRARASLRTVLWDLRQVVAPYLAIDRQRVGLEEEAPHWVDVVAFGEGIEAALPDVATETAPTGPGTPLSGTLGRALGAGQVEALERAVSLYRGELLAGFYVSEAPAFEDWVLKKREWARHLAIQALHRLIGHHAARGSYATGIDTATRLLEIAPWKEEAHRQLMTLLALSGQRSAALAQYETCQRMLAEELGVEPTAETQLLYERIQSGEPLPGEEEGGLREPMGRGALRKPRERRALLGWPPSPASPLIGREEELDELTRALRDPERRLVTLSGAAGVGRTRLALAAVEAVAEAFEDGVCYVSLCEAEPAEVGPGPACPGPSWGDEEAGSRASSRLAVAIGRALGTTFSAGTPPMVQLLDYVRHRTMLLVLDDVDDDPALRAAIAALAERALYVTVLAIADGPLEAVGELSLQLAGLPVPPSSAGRRPEELLRYESVALFVRRADGAKEGFELTARDGRDVVRICRTLRGVPLSLELAARAGGRSLSALAHGLQRSVNRAAAGATGLSEEARGSGAAGPSLASAFEIAWEALAPTAQRKLAELSAFREGFDDAAAAAVTGSTGEELDGLVERGLLSRRTGGRYAWHPALRRLARKRLGEVSAAADGPTLGRRHAAHYLGLAAEGEEAVCGGSPETAASKIEQAWSNVRQAWCWAVGQPDVELLTRGIEGLSCYLLLRGPLWEGEELFGAAARALGTGEEPGSAALVARLLVEEARFVNGQTRYRRAAAIARRAIEIARREREAGEEAGGDAIPWLALEAAGRRERGEALRAQGAHGAARDELEEALRQARESGAERVRAGSWHQLGVLALEEERQEEAREAFERALAVYREVGHRRGEATLLNELGAVALQERRYAAARSQLEDALRIHQTMGDRRGESAARNHLARLADAQGDYELADAHGERALRVARDGGDQQAEARALTTLGLLFLHEGKNEEAWNRSLQAVELTRALGDRAGEGRALVVLGHAFMELEMVDQAEKAYEEALRVQRALGQADLASESLAGLARVSLERGDVAQAESHVETIWGRLEEGDLCGATEPLRVYLTCYQVLREQGDPRANAVLSTASGMFDGMG